MRTYRGDRKTATVANGGVAVSAVATAFTVASSTDFPGPGTLTLEVQTTGESIIVTAGLGTTSWSAITRGANQTTAAVIPDGSVLLEISGANDYANFQQKDDTGLGTSLLASTTPIVDGVGAVGTSAVAARADHVHPTSGGGAGDATTSSVGSVEVDHAPSGAHPIAMTLDGTAIPSTMLGAGTPAADGTGAAGTAVQASRSDHIHPLVTSFAAEITATDLKVTGLTGSVTASRYVGMTASGAPSTGPHLVGDWILSLADAKVYVCTVAGTPGTWVTPPASSGTVTSVGLSLPADFTVSGTPVTGTGTLTAVRANQSANVVQAGPATGAAAAPTYRALVAADVPAVNPSALTGTGTVPLAGLSGITDTQIAAANKDGVAGTASLRTLGTGAQQATAGTDSRLSDSRVPTGSAGGDLTGTYPNPVFGLSGVVAGTYGDSSHVPVVTIDAKGRTTSVATAAITSATHAESLTDGSSNFIFAGGDVVTVVGVRN